MTNGNRLPDDFEVGDKVKLSELGKDRGVYQFPNMRGVVTGHNKHGCVMVQVGRRKLPFRPEFIEKE